MVNEIGEIAIDSELIVGIGDGMVDFANGCICCSIDDDLMEAIFRVLQRDRRVDYLIVETTGLAEPLPIALTFLRAEFRDAVRVVSIVALADAESFSLDQFDSKAALNQLRYADFVLLDKCDIVAPQEADAVEENPRDRQGRPDRAHHRAQLPLPLILGAGLFRGESRLRTDDHDHHHIAADGFEAVSFAERLEIFGRAVPGLSRTARRPTSFEQKAY